MLENNAMQTKRGDNVTLKSDLGHTTQKDSVVALQYLESLGFRSFRQILSTI